MRKIVRQDGKKVCLDTETDETIYDTPNRSDNGRDNTRGIDLMRHEIKSGGEVFYKLHWSRWQGENTYIEEISKDEAAGFVEENYESIGRDEEALAIKYGLLKPDELE